MNRSGSWVVLAAATVTVALSDGRQGWWWILPGLLIIPAVALAPRQHRAEHRSTDVTPAAESTPPLTPPVARRLFMGKPPPRAGAFQNRRALLGDLGAESVVLCGVGGAGKTQLAAEHARRAWESGGLDVLLWIDAASRDKILSGLGDAAAALLGAVDSYPQAADRLLNWLASSGQRWLIVLDDLRDPQDLHRVWAARTRYGQVVVTTRCRDAAIPAVVEIGPFTPNESTRFLTERLAARPGQIDGAGALADALGDLPKGLAQAATYIANRPDLTCATYRAWFEDRHRPLSRLRPDRLPDDHGHPIEATWSSSIDDANGLTPRGLARPLLALLALLDSDGVPETVLTAMPTLIYLRRTGRRPVNAETAKGALSCLHRFSLITYDPATRDRTVRIHPLVQRAVHETLTGRDIATAARAAANALSQAWPKTERDSVRAAVLRDNVTALRKAAGAHLWHRRARAVLFRAGHSLGECGRPEAARDYFQALVDLARGELRHRSLTALHAQASLAHWQGEAGDPSGAAVMLAELIRVTRRTLDRTHPFMLRVRRGYARWRTDAGEPVGATELDELVNDFLHAVGPDHPDTLYARNIRARRLADTGAATELVGDFLRIRGPDHPDTLSARNNLAVIYAKAGDFARAAIAFTELLDDLHRVFGPDHPKTLRTLNNLARCRTEAGDAPSGACR